MFFNPRLNRERKGGEIVFTAATEVKIPKIAASDYIKKTVNKELVTDTVPEGATACSKLIFKVGFTDEIKEKIEKHTRISGNDEEYVKKAIAENVKILGFSDHAPNAPRKDGYESYYKMSPEET